jgi:hypothetical protein
MKKYDLEFVPEKLDVWMSYEDAMVLKKLMAQQEEEYLRHTGLGWLVDFCSHKINDNEKL